MEGGYVTTPAVDMDYQYCVSLKLISLWTKIALCIGHVITLNLLGCTVCLYIMLSGSTCITLSYWSHAQLRTLSIKVQC